VTGIPEPDADGRRRVLATGTTDTVVRTTELVRHAGAVSFELRWDAQDGRTSSSTDEQHAAPPRGATVTWSAIALLPPHPRAECPTGNRRRCRSRGRYVESIIGTATNTAAGTHERASQLACVELLRRLGATVTTS
jgi:hypothetical protein